MRQKPTTSGYRERLARALERGPRPMSVRGLHKALENRFPDLRGTSYGGVRHYVEGKVTSPRVDLLRAMADVLEVRPDWLAFDDGPMLEEEARATEGLRQAAPERLQTMYDMVCEREPILERLPYRFVAALLDYAGERAAAERGRRYITVGKPLEVRSPTEQQEEILRLADDAWKEIARPLARSATLATYAVYDYLEAAILAKRLALRIPTSNQEDNNG